mmetsp:Transcript_9137/g.22636  ORF Transcript_9137/g.22636 Transcript_9137/m.22636 type:complete len:382 (-) Transcript_9137:2168-3313(-)|eukprot:CAMPEP_0202865620 /NCGR_PEP_ID=MMETSP1391-20130828/6263_1 /ASSEMBLY_ACC=CAM_ASM_000867 /TAXON_ID=1034604 /ORGANISM="Chlamydomonas leiostraca, Strain SAG 11-49" /LENGTH=381 /DNA_ID=CAMNT_0049545483 /DNA_START=435 /DNA_END=1580 /DNA_ORIENTATION=-
MTTFSTTASGCAQMSMFPFFDMELEAEQGPDASSGPAWNVQLAPTTAQEKLVASAASAALSAWPELSAQPAALGQALLAALPEGTRVAVRRTLPPSSSRSRSDPAFALRNLRHEFLVVNLPLGDGLIVETRFGSHFELSCASKAFRDAAAALPSLVVLSADALKEAIKILVGHATSEYKVMGEPLPPWRSLPAQLSKWLAPEFQDTPVWARMLPSTPCAAAASAFAAAAKRGPSFSSASSDRSTTFDRSSIMTVTSESEADAAGTSPVSVLPGRAIAGWCGADVTVTVQTTVASKAAAAAGAIASAAAAPISAAAVTGASRTPAAPARVRASPMRCVLGFSVGDGKPAATTAPAAAACSSAAPWEGLLPRMHVVRRSQAGR